MTILPASGAHPADSARRSMDRHRREPNMPLDAFKSASELTHAIRSRKVKSRELLEMYLERVEGYNPQLNAVVHLKADERANGRTRQTQPSPPARSGVRFTECQ